MKKSQLRSWNFLYQPIIFLFIRDISPAKNTYSFAQLVKNNFSL